MNRIKLFALLVFGSILFVAQAAAEPPQQTPSPKSVQQAIHAAEQVQQESTRILDWRWNPSMGNSEAVVSGPLDWTIDDNWRCNLPSLTLTKSAGFSNPCAYIHIQVVGTGVKLPPVATRVVFLPNGDVELLADN